MYDLRCVYHDRATLGEGVFWSARERCVFWVDIEQGRVCRYDPMTGAHREVSLGQQVGAAIEHEGGGLVVGLKDGLYALDFERGETRFLCDPMAGNLENRLNDGKAGPDGRLYIGSMGAENEQNLYRIEHDGKSYHSVQQGVTCSNGLCWAADGKTLYYVDSPKRTVDAFDFDPREGRLENRRVLVDLRAEESVPDGMCIDEEGGLWVAIWEGGCVRRFDSDNGQETMRIQIPVSRVTCCSFGGDDGGDLYVTTASVGFSEADWQREPQAGGLFVCRPGMRGRSNFLFAGDWD